MDTSNSGGSQSATVKDTSASAPPSLSERLRERSERFHGDYFYYVGSDAVLDVDAARAIEYAVSLTPMLRAEIAAKDARIAELEAALAQLLRNFEDEIHSEYDGTSMLAGRLAEADFARAALAGSRE